MSTFDDKKLINGLYGYVFDGDGRQIQTTQEFEALIKFKKEAVMIAGQFLETHRVVGGSGSGNLVQLKIDSRLTRAIAENPTEKYNFQGKLKDPTSNGEEAVTFIGVSFDEVTIMAFTLGELVETDLPFTFDGFRYDKSI